MKKTIYLAFYSILFLLVLLIIVLGEVGKPQWSDNSTNATFEHPKFNETIQMNVTLTSNVSLDSYIFSWNCTSERDWVNDSATKVFSNKQTNNVSGITYSGISHSGTLSIIAIISGNEQCTDSTGTSGYISPIPLYQLSTSGYNGQLMNTSKEGNLSIEILSDTIYSKTGTCAVSGPGIPFETFTISSGATINLTIGDKNNLQVYLPEQSSTNFLTLYISQDGSTYYDEALTNLAQPSQQGNTIPITKTINITNHPNSCSWKVYFNDTSGNWNETDNFTFSVINTPPNQPTLQYPPDKYIISTDYTTLNFTGTDNDNDTLYFYVLADTNNPPTTIVWHSRNETSNNNHFYNFTGLTDETTYYWRVHADDNLSNSSNSSIRSFTVSSSAPAINIYYPLNNSWNNSQTDNISISFITDDTEDVDWCGFYINSSNGWHLNQTKNITKNLVSNFTINLTDETKYFYNIRCNDSSGNAGWYPYGNITFGIDTIEPNLTVTSPANGASYNAVTTNLIMSANDTFIEKCSYYLYYRGDYGTNLKESNLNIDCGGTTSISTPFATYRLVVSANDSAGNINSTEINFTTETAPPEPPFTGGAGALSVVEIFNETQEPVIITERLCNSNGKCEAIRGEDFLNCPNDCKFEISALLPTCLADKYRQCFWRSALVSKTITLLMVLSVVILFFLSEEDWNKLKKKFKNLKSQRI